MRFSAAAHSSAASFPTCISPISPASPRIFGLKRLSRHTTAFTRAGSTPYLRAAATMCLSWLSSRYVRERSNQTMIPPRAITRNNHGHRRLIASMHLLPGVPDVDLARQLLHDPFHFKAKERDGNRGNLQTSAANYLVDRKLFAIGEEIVNALLALRQRECRRSLPVLRSVARREEILELGENILRIFTELRAILNELMTALAARRIGPSRDGKHLASVIVGELCRNECTARQVGFDHHGPKRHAGHDPIPNRKALLVRGAVEWKLCHHGSIRRNALEQFRVLRRKNNVDARAKHGNGAAFGVQRTLVGRGINPTRAAAHYGDAAQIGKLITKSARRFQTVMSCLPRTDDCHHIPIVGAQPSFNVEHNRRVINLPQERGVFLVTRN